MTQGVQNQAQLQDGWKLLETRKKQLESAQAQTKAVQEEFTKLQGESAQVKSLDDDLAKKIMVLSNFNVKTPPTEPKAPKEVKDPGAEPKFEGTDSTAPEAKLAFEEKHEAWKKQDAEFKKYQADLTKYKEEKAQYDKDKKEYDQYKALESEIKAKAPDDVKNNLTKLMDAAQAKEAELKKAQGDEAELQREVDFSWNNYQELQAQLKDAKFDITLNNQGDNLTKVGKDLVNKASIDGSKADTNAVYNGIIDGDKENKVNDNYKKMKVGDSHTYNLDQVKKMGVDTDLSDDFGADFGASMNNLLSNAPSAKPENDGKVTGGAAPTGPQGTPHVENSKPEKEDPNKKYHVGNLTLPRGGATNHGKDASSLEALGLQENPNGTYTDTKSGQVYSASELNTMFRGMEKGVDPNYPKLLDKAEKLGLDIDAITKGDTSKQSVDDLKAAIDAKEKADKAAKKQAKKDKKAEKEGREAEAANEALDKAKNNKVGADYNATIKDSDKAKKALDKYKDEIAEMKKNNFITDADLASMTADQIKDLVKKYKAAQKEGKQAAKAGEKADNYRAKSDAARTNFDDTMNRVTTNGFKNLPSIIQSDAKMVLNGQAKSINGATPDGAYSIVKSGSDSITITYKGNKITISADEV